MTAPERALIIGGGLAAVTTAAQLRAGGFTGPVTIAGAESELPYDRPPLTKGFLTGSDTEIELQPYGWFSDQGVELRTGVPVTKLDPDAGQVELADGATLTADVVVLATGGSPRTLPAADPTLYRVLRTRDDAVALRARLLPGARLLVIGAGLIGAEVTASATTLGCSVTLVDPSPLPLAGAVGPEAAAYLHHRHTDHGVTTLQARLGSLTPGCRPGTVQATLSTGAVVDADVVLVSIGILPNVDLAATAGLDTADGVLVGPDLRSSHPSVYAIGDIARVTRADGAQVRIEHWDNARRTAETAARSILNAPPAPAKTPWFWTDRYGQHLEMAGHYDPAAEPVGRGDLPGGRGSIFYLRDGYCVGAVSIDAPLDIRAAQRFIDRRIPLTAHQLADQSTDLRAHLR